MLQDIRETFIGTTGKVVLAIILLLLAGTGLNYTLTPKQFAARVNGEEIPIQEFDREYQSLLRQFGDQQIPAFFLDQLRSQAVEQVIQARTIQQHLADQGFAVSDVQLREFIAAVPGFQVDGQFDSDAYRTVLRDNGFTPAVYENNLRRVLASQQFVGTMLQTEFVTPAEIREFIELRDEQREVEYVVISPDSFKEDVTVTEADVVAYFEGNPDRYRTPETVDIDYVVVDREAAAGLITVTDEALQSFFDGVSDEYVAPEERRASQILLAVGDDAEAANAQALDLLSQLEAGADFAELAEAFSIDAGSARQGGDLGWVRPGDFVGPVEDAVYALEPGQVSGVVRSEFGLHILRLEDVRGGGDATLDDVRDEVADRFRETLVDDRLFGLQGQVSDLEFEGASLDQIVSDTGLTLQSFEGYHESRQQPFGEVAEIRDALFADGAAAADENLRLVQYEDATVVLRVKNRVAAGRQPIANVEGQIRELLVDQAAQAVADERGAQLASVLATDPTISFEALTVNSAATSYPKRLVGRSDAEIPAALAAAVFAAPTPNNASEPHTGNVAAPGSGFVIYRLTQVVPGDPSVLEQPLLDATRRQLAQQRAALQLDAMTRELRESADVEIGPLLQIEQQAAP
ncbi:MAG: SurA N-terminal domain-containing protein [Pseudomonadota bacterium]